MPDLTKITYTYNVQGQPEASQMLGNGRRRIVPNEAEVIISTSGLAAYAVVTGRLIRHDGTHGRYALVGWTKDEPMPDWVADLIDDAQTRSNS